MRKTSQILFTVAGAAVTLGLAILLLTFGPLAGSEVKYAVRKAHPTEITPVDKQFGIVIPKLGANAHIVPSVDPYNVREYEYALTKGVAQAKGTSVPGEPGNLFLFAHSSENFYVALQYNSIFYLINKLEKGDQILIYYGGAKFSYKVTDKKFVNPKDVSYLSVKSIGGTLTLMTCWPPGTDTERLLVFAELKK